MVDKEFVIANGKSGSDYMASISEKYIDNWQKKLNQVEFSDEQLSFLQGDFYPINIVALSADWCPDCRNAIPILIKIAHISDFVTLHIIDRDDNKEYLNREEYLTNGGLRVPYIVFTNEKFQNIDTWAERSYLAYQYVLEAKKQALEEGTDDFGQFRKEKFKTNSAELFAANLDDIFSRFKKSVLLRTSAMKLEEFKQPITQ